MLVAEPSTPFGRALWDAMKGRSDYRKVGGVREAVNAFRGGDRERPVYDVVSIASQAWDDSTVVAEGSVGDGTDGTPGQLLLGLDAKCVVVEGDLGCLDRWFPSPAELQSLQQQESCTYACNL